MEIYIPTMGRVLQQDTWESLRGSSYDITLVCPKNELGDHVRQHRRVISPPDSVQRIAATRMWIMSQAKSNRVVMMDDDLTFAARRLDEPEKFRRMDEGDVRTMLTRLDTVLGSYAHASIAMREGANRDESSEKYCSRVARVIGYQRDVFLASGADFRNSTVMDDFEVTLHLLTLGYPNAIINDYVQNQRSSGAAGGASLYRDLDMQKAAAEKLASRYPKFVKTVEKTTKTAWGGATRTDVIVQWKKAFEYGRGIV